MYVDVGKDGLCYGGVGLHTNRLIVHPSTLVYVRVPREPACLVSSSRQSIKHYTKGSADVVNKTLFISEMTTPQNCPSAVLERDKDLITKVLILDNVLCQKKMSVFQCFCNAYTCHPILHKIKYILHK